jgi:hypothetical protein
MTGHTGALMATSTPVKNTQRETLTLIPLSVPLYGSQILLVKVLEVQMCY